MQIWRFTFGKSRRPAAEIREPILCPVPATRELIEQVNSPSSPPDPRVAFIQYLVETGRIHDRWAA